MNFIYKFWKFLRARKKYRLLPIVIVLALFGERIILARGLAVAT